MNKNLTVQMGNCNHRRYIPRLLDMVASGVVEPTKIITQDKPMKAGLEAFEAFDRRETGWIKVELEPEAAGA